MLPSTAPPLRPRLPLYAAGTLLVVAAGLKAESGGSDLGVGPLSLAPPIVNIVTALELAAGLFLLLARPLAPLLFASFAAISLTNALLGKASCGCAGAHQVSPWYSLAVSVAMLAALALTRPAPGEVRVLLAAGARRALSPSTLIVAAPAILAVAAYSANPAPFDRQFAALRGETLMVRPFALDYGELPPGGSATMALEVVNLGGEPVELLGGRSDCGCTVTQDLPQTILPGATATVRVRIDTKPNAESKFYRSSVELLSTRGTIVSSARWRVVAPAE